MDFVIKQGDRIRELIQVTAGTEIKEREIRALLVASKELRCKNLVVITSEKEAKEYAEWKGVREKIKFIPLWKWLIEKPN